MDLAEFVKQTLTSITQGVVGARAGDAGSAIAPDRDGAANTAEFLYYASDDRLAFPVHFDVAVTVADSSEKSGEAGVKVWAASFGAGIKGSSSETKVSRVSFVVPIAYPRAAPAIKDNYQFTPRKGIV